MKPDFQEQQSDLTMPLPAQEQQNPQEPIPQESTHEAAVAASVEKAQSAPDPSMTPDPQAPPPMPPLPPDPTSTVLPAGITSAAGMPMIADDTDLIEKEWVEKAKQIVERTSHDPYLQSKELNKLKSDYLKKRYNKDLKLGDE
jgi:hypothetical protein